MKRQPNRSQSFWTTFFFAAFASLGALLLRSPNPADHKLAWICIGLFGSMTLISTVWEFARHHQGEPIRWHLLQLEGVERKVLFFPGSRLEKWFILAILSICCATTVAMVTHRGSLILRLETGLMVVLFFAALAAFVSSSLTRTQGIALLPSGVLWLKEKHPLLIPWESIDCIASSKAAQDVGHSFKIHTPALGIRLLPNYQTYIYELPPTGPHPLSTKKRSLISATKEQHGFELIYFEESLLISAEEAARLLKFFLDHPKHRPELNHTQNQLGFLESLSLPTHF